MYKYIKIYTRTRCQVSVYRTTGPLVLNLVTIKFRFRHALFKKRFETHIKKLIPGRRGVDRNLKTFYGVCDTDSLV